jgi:hypothetical protein
MKWGDVSLAKMECKERLGEPERRGVSATAAADAIAAAVEQVCACRDADCAIVKSGTVKSMVERYYRLYSDGDQSSRVYRLFVRHMACRESRR